MKRQYLLLLITVLFGGAINAQQITQQFSFSQNDVQISQSGEYDILSLPGTEFLQGEDNAGKPQLPVKHFKLLLPQGAVATDVTITVNSENQLQGNFYLYPVQFRYIPVMKLHHLLLNPIRQFITQTIRFRQTMFLNTKQTAFVITTMFPLTLHLSGIFP